MINYIEDTAAKFHELLANEIEKESERIINDEWNERSEIESIKYYDFVTDWIVCNLALELTIKVTYKVLYHWDIAKDDDDFIITFTTTNFNIEKLANEITSELGSFIQCAEISSHDPREYHKEAHL